MFAGKTNRQGMAYSKGDPNAPDKRLPATFLVARLI
jgi:hypothetical protein